MPPVSASPDPEDYTVVVKTRKNWREKMNKSDLPKVVVLPDMPAEPPGLGLTRIAVQMYSAGVS